MTQRARGITLGVVGALAIVGAMFLPDVFRSLVMGAGIVLLLFGGSSAGPAGGAADRLVELTDRPVRVVVWGQPLHESADEGMQVEAMQAFGGGLLIRLRPRAGGAPGVLKVARPRATAFDRAAGRATIAEAEYVEWRRARLPRAHGEAAAPALVLELIVLEV